MVNIQQKDIFLTKSGLQRIDQLLGMKSKDHLCLVQSEDNLLLFEVWNLNEESIVLQKKVQLHNYELSSNVVSLESDQLAFYGVIQESGVQCLFLVDIYYQNNLKQQKDQNSQNEMGICNQESQQNHDNCNLNICKVLVDSLGADKSLCRFSELSNQFQKNEQDNVNDQQNSNKVFKNMKNNGHPEPNIFDIYGNVITELNERIQSNENKNNIKIIVNNIDQNPEKNDNDNIEKFNSFEDAAIQSLPVIEDKNLTLFIEQLANKQDISCMGSFITQDNCAASVNNELENIIDDINCINNFQNNYYYQNNIDNLKHGFTQYQQENQEDPRQNNEFLSENSQNTNNYNNILYKSEQKQLSENYEEKTEENNQFSNNIFQTNQNFNGSSNLTKSQQSDQLQDLKYKYQAENKGISCIYDLNQRELFVKCIEFCSEILGHGYNGILIVKNTYYMTNFDDSYYMLLVLSVYRTGNTQQFAQYILRNEVKNLNNSVQVICVQNTHQVIIYDPSNDEIIIWSYFGDTLTPTYYQFQQFQSLYIKYCFQNSLQPTTYHFIYKDPQSNLYKILNYDFKTGNNITKGFPNKEMSQVRSPIIIKQQEAYVIKHNKQNMLVISTIYKNNELTTYWNVYQLNCNYANKNEEVFLSQIHTHLDCSETDNNDTKTHFVPDFSLVSPNIFFFNTSDIYIDIQQAISTFIHNKDIHFKAIQILND